MKGKRSVQQFRGCWWLGEGKRQEASPVVSLSALLSLCLMLPPKPSKEVPFSGFREWGKRPAELARGSLKPKMESDLKSHLPSPHAGQGLLFHSTISSAAPFPTLHQIGQAPALPTSYRPWGTLGLFPAQEWKKELPKHCWNQNSKHTRGGREGANTNKLPLDSCAYTLLKKKCQIQSPKFGGC